MSLLIGLCCTQERPVDFVGVEGEPDQEIETFTLRQSVDGELTWELVAELAFVWDDTHQAVAARPTVNFYENGEHRAVLTAGEGTINLLTNDMETREGVVVVSDDGATLKTEVLGWDNRRQRLFTNLVVTYETGGTVLTGSGFESDSDLTDWKIRHPRGTVSPEELGGEVF
ncbi:LPS export ABC transporter periplasmic protein LptC [bacterium]|nr:LPS export ABC transporter periplasmic protein LptC [bacterium]